MFRKKKMPEECLNTEAENDDIDCFLCQEIVKSCEYNKHLEKQHGVIFGLKEIIKAGEKSQSSRLNEEPKTVEAEPKIIRTDADTVKEMVEMKYLSNKKRIRLQESKTEIVLEKYHVLLNKQQRLTTRS